MQVKNQRLRTQRPKEQRQAVIAKRQQEGRKPVAVVRKLAALVAETKKGGIFNEYQRKNPR